MQTVKRAIGAEGKKLEATDYGTGRPTEQTGEEYFLQNNCVQNFRSLQMVCTFLCIETHPPCFLPSSPLVLSHVRCERFTQLLCTFEGVVKKSSWYVTAGGPRRSDIPTCGRSQDQPCHDLKTVMDRLHAGDTVVLVQTDEQCAGYTKPHSSATHPGIKNNETNDKDSASTKQRNKDSSCFQEASFKVPFELKSARSTALAAAPATIRLISARPENLLGVSMKNTLFIQTNVEIVGAVVHVVNSTFENSFLSLSNSVNSSAAVISQCSFFADNGLITKTLLLVEGTWNRLVISESNLAAKAGNRNAALGLVQCAIEEVAVVDTMFSDCSAALTGPVRPPSTVDHGDFDATSLLSHLHPLSTAMNQSSFHIRLNRVHIASSKFMNNVQSLSLSEMSVRHLYVFDCLFKQNGPQPRNPFTEYNSSSPLAQFSQGIHLCSPVLQASNTTVTIVNTSVEGNTASCGAGLVQLSFANVTIAHSLFHLNSAGSSEHKGIVVVEHGEVLLKHCMFVENTGVLHLLESVDATMDNCTFQNNTESKDSEFHGFIIIARQSEVVMRHCKLIGNVGKVLHVYDSFAVTFEHCLVSKHSAQDGNVFELYNNVAITFENCTFDHNEASDENIVHMELCTVVFLVHCAVKFNSAPSGATLFIAQGVDMTITHSLFVKNRALAGAVLDAADVTALTVRFSHFESNHAVDAGCVLAYGTNITVDRCHFVDNEAADTAGVLHLQEAVVRVFSSTFRGNAAASTGGVVHFDGQEKAIAFYNSSFARNTAARGAVLFCALAVVSNCIFELNDGPTIILDSDLLLQNSFFSNRKASTAPVPLSLIEDSTFRNNTMSSKSVLYFTNPVSLRNIVICSAPGHSQAVGILSTVDIYLLNVSIQGLLQVATLSGLQRNKTITHDHQILSIVCPDFTEPTIVLDQTGHLTITGEYACKYCKSGYYVGDRRMINVMHDGYVNVGDASTDCNQFLYFGVSFLLCHSKIQGNCLACPHGSDCNSGLIALPNYWGRTVEGDVVLLVRCPYGYCCQVAPCVGIDSCAAGRHGDLCGQCQPGFTEAFLSTECTHNAECRHSWFFFVYVCWILVLSFTVISLNDTRILFDNCFTKLKSTLRHSTRHSSSLDMPSTSQPQKTHENHQSHPVEENNRLSKRKGLFLIKKPEPTLNDSHVSDHKYIQIILFYLQDASLMQIDLPKNTPSGSNLQESLFEMSQLTLKMFHFGKTMCVWPDIGPVGKLLLQNMTGPCVLALLLILYLTVVSVSWFSTRVASIRQFWYIRLAPAAIFVLLLFFQKMASVSMSLIYCVNIGERHLLFIDGTVACYQPWQYGVFLFIFMWVIPFCVVLIFGPGLLADRHIQPSEFFLGTAFPLIFLFYWLYKHVTHKTPAATGESTVWHSEMVEALSKSFKDISLVRVGPICWIGVIKTRRLILVIIFAFTSNLLWRLGLMIGVNLFALYLHTNIHPYQDNMANQAFSVSLMATVLIGLINLSRATVVESLVDLQNVSTMIAGLEAVTDVVMLWAPVAVLCTYVIVKVAGRIAAKFVKPKKIEGEVDIALNDTERVA